MTRPANIAYLDCFSGISGDMLLGALIDCGLAPEHLHSNLEKLDLDPFDLAISRKKIQAISATSVTVSSKTSQSFKNLTHISTILEKSRLDERIIRRSLEVFRRLAEAEAQVHDRPVADIHFHEVGALDTIIDIVGAVIGFHLLGITTIYCSPLPLGRGFVRCAHGNLPLPAPAVCKLLEGIPVHGVETDMELVTPTGAALVSVLADSFGNIPPMTVKATGYGAGDFAGTEDRPNLLRLITGHGQTLGEAQQVEVIETHLDDWSPEGYPYLCEKLFAAHALDVSLTPIQMKKGRPGFSLRVICRPHDGLDLKEIILSETTAIGLRFRQEQRVTLPREQVEVSTTWGLLSAKKVETPAGTMVYPEYEACRAVAEKHAVTLNQVYREVLSRSGKDF